jgi:tyrosine-protein kinase Etk/Wzc
MQPVNEIGQEIRLEASKPATMEFDLLDLMLALAARKRLIFLFSLACMVAAAIVVYFVLRPTFTGKAVIMPPQQEQSTAAALMGQFSALASLTGMGGSGGGNSLGLKNPDDLYIGLLKSETVADGLIKQFDLMRLYHAQKLSQARAVLASNSKFLSGKLDPLITISVEDHDPHRAAAMANAYVDQLYKLNNRLAISEASQRRLFFEQQLSQEKDKLADAEVALKQTEESTGVISPSGQTDVTIRQIAQLQAEITMHEVQLDALHTSSTEQNPDVIRLNTELDGLRAQLQTLENGQEKHTPGNISIPTANVPAAGLEYIRKERDVKYHQLLFDLLARQYEAARMDEAKAVPVIQVVDTALVPDRKSGPHHILWLLIFGFLGFVIGCTWVLTSHIYHLLQNDERTGPRLAVLKRDLKFGR